MLYSKLGSIPKPETDGTEGWIEVEVAPTPGPGEEVVWWYPPGWVTRPLQPVKEGFVYNWSQSEGVWVESPVSVEQTLPTIEVQIPDTGTASATIEIGTLASSTTL